ncbi:oxygen-independent coproporphyrinogen III oxidase [Castellaniella caeni]|uniref:oxygen-independent coproporphyrinogen III oxidase n=1 Tax=Castellaniella caeni TaxID=266123 RepID=UPI00082CB14A|nr:oxygen-independent coproporphyrinogen III oxidase [Castellaniella caeni]
MTSHAVSDTHACADAPGTARAPASAPVIAVPDLEISEALIRRFDQSGPRYTSYPTADRFERDYPAATYIQHLERRSAQPSPAPLSVYVHLPFCESLCYFCGCNKIITQDHSRSAQYLDIVFHEMALVSQHLGNQRQTVQLHLGGGTPTFLSAAELTLLMEHIRRYFEFTPDAELGVEIDPRTVSPASLAMLAGLGFNRTSFGVQDFDPDVQAAVNRIQPYDMVRTALQASRDNGFQSINADLIYGLPKQTLASFSRTLDQLIELSPDRIALYNYAHLPDRFKSQRLIRAEDLPSAEARLQIFLMSVQRLLAAGYVYIGLDHFAKPDDELNRARLDRSLHRNFQGYTTRAECDLIGFGISAIGKVGDAYIQNQHSLNAYTAALERNELPTAKGYTLSREDAIRREVIMTIMCSMPLDFAQFEARHGQSFASLFADELQRLRPYADAGLLALDAQGLRVLPKGRVFVRAFSMVFDQFIRKPRVATYSKLI